uniref:Uncharacterized protein n=1 Tax=Chlamydomonas chlamydogama TaxID=225041 RepID=A0A7S2QUF5_9CHLO
MGEARARREAERAEEDEQADEDPAAGGGGGTETKAELSPARRALQLALQQQELVYQHLRALARSYRAESCEVAARLVGEVLGAEGVPPRAGQEVSAVLRLDLLPAAAAGEEGSAANMES